MSSNVETPMERRARLKLLASLQTSGIKGATSPGSVAAPSIPSSSVSAAPAVSGKGSPARKRTRTDSIADTANKGKIKVGVSGLEVAVPDPSNPACQKLNHVLRYVPHAHVSISQKAKAYKLISPMTYGACIAEQEAKPGLTLTECEDLALQKLGEAARYATMVREIAAADCVAKDQQLAERSTTLQKEVDALKLERDEAKTEGAKHRDEVVRLGGEIKKLERERDELTVKLADLAKEETDEVMLMYDASVRLAVERGKARYSDIGVDWDSLFHEPNKEDLEAAQQAQRSQPAVGALPPSS